MAAFKAQATAMLLQQNLQLQLPSVVIALSYDSNFFPILKITNASEIQYVYIEAEPDGSAHVNSLGLPQTVYSPHQAIVLRVPDADAVDPNTRNLVAFEVSKMGMKIQIYEVTPIPASFTLAGATLVSTIGSDPINKETESQ